MPPSAMMGIPASRAASAHSITADNCGTPEPATIRVIQIEPGTHTHFDRITPASINRFVPSAVATFPPMIWAWENACGYFDHIDLKIANRREQYPQRCSPRLLARAASTRRISLSRTPTAAPTIKRPRESLVAFGYCVIFIISFKVTSPVPRGHSHPPAEVSQCGARAIIFRHPSRRFRGPVMHIFLHNLGDRGLLSLFSNNKSRVVMMPTSFFAVSRSKFRLYRFRSQVFSHHQRCWSVHRDRIFNDEGFGFLYPLDLPCLLFNGQGKRWMMPMPPSRAIAIAISLSVTTSMLAETMGICKVIFFVKRVWVESLRRESTLEYCGTKQNVVIG
jgi:hypothetical protein